MRIAAHQATTRHVAALYPWMGNAGLGSRGVPSGADIFGGGRSFCFDPFEQYHQRGLTNPNVAVMGDIGKGKSSFVKTWLWRWLPGAGRQGVVLDVKPEYYELARRLGVPSVQLGATSGVCLNPLDPRVSGDRQLSLLEALCGTRLRRALSEPERLAIEFGHAAAVEVAATLGRQPELGDVMAAMFSPDTTRLSGVGFTSVEQFVATTREAALAVRGLAEGRLRGALNGQTSAVVDLRPKLLHFDLSSERDSGDIGVLMCAASAFLAAAVDKDDGIARAMVVDEAWRLLDDPHTARWLRGSAKLCRRGRGVAHIFVLHRFGDVEGAGDKDSSQRAHAAGVLSDVGTRVLYGLTLKDARAAQEALGLTDCETKTLTELPPATALWRVGTKSFLVEAGLVQSHPAEAAIVENGMTQ